VILLVFVGMDHGTTGISFGIISNDGVEIDNFKIDREDTKAGKVSAIEELKKRVSIDQINLMAITYGMGDGINKIMAIEKVKNRGILSIEGAGRITGGGTSVYSEIKKSKIPTVVIPGLHKDSPSLDPLFKAAYSHLASSEKVSISYNAVNTTNWKNMIIADISSNSVNILIENGKIRGAMDACIGAMGIIHGPLDLEMIRNIDENKLTANEAFSTAGASKIAKIDEKVAFIKDILVSRYERGDTQARLAIDTLVFTVAMEILGLAGIAKTKIDGIVLTGSIGSMKHPIDFENLIKKYLKDKFEIFILPSSSGAFGSAQIAKDVYNNKKNILGIEVDNSIKEK
jgi:putative methanogenesis marker protein 12